MRRLLAPAMVLALAACSGTSSTTRCGGAVQGKITGTFSVCNTLEQFYRQNLDEYVFSASYTELPSSFVMVTEWEIKGEPSERTYSQDTMTAECKVSVKKGTPGWLARKGSGVPTSGTCQLVFAELEEVTPQEGNLINYKVRGSLAARLEPETGTGSTEVVQLQMDFCQGDAAFCPPLMP